MAFSTIWSVDLGKSALKAVKLRREKNSVEILAVDKVDYPLSENGADQNQQSREALNVFRSRNEIKDPIVVAHPGQGTFSRFIKLPAFDPKKVREMVRFEASQQIPFPLDEVIWDYHLVERDYLPGEEREVGLFAVRKEAIDDYLLEFTQEGLAVEMLTIGYLGLLNFIRFDINPPEPAIVLDIGATHTDLILVDGARFWIRPLPHSGNEISKAIMARFKIGFVEAEKLKIETAKATQQGEKIYKAVIQPKLQELLQEVQRALGYYRSQHGETKFSRIYLLGNGSRIVQLKKFFEDALGIPVERVQSIGRLRVSRDVNLGLLKDNLPAFGTALGMGIQAVGVGQCQVDLVPKEEKLKKEISRKRKHVFFAAAGLLLAILTSWWLVGSKTAGVKADLEEFKSSDAQVKFALDAKQVAKIAKAEKETVGDLNQSIDLLLELADVRNGALEGLRALERVLTPTNPEPPMVAVIRSGDEEGKKKALDERLARLAREIWVPYLRIDRISYPEDAGAGAGTSAGGRKGKAAAEARPTVPAYKLTAYAVVKEGEAQQASIDAIKARLRAPLETDLLNANTRWTVVKDVGANPGTTGLKNIYYAPGGTAGGGRADEIPETVGGPFFGQEVFWYMLPRHPRAPVVVEATTESDEADKPSKKPSKKPGKKPSKTEPEPEQ